MDYRLFGMLLIIWVTYFSSGFLEPLLCSLYLLLQVPAQYGTHVEMGGRWGGELHSEIAYFFEDYHELVIIFLLWDFLVPKTFKSRDSCEITHRLLNWELSSHALWFYLSDSTILYFINARIIWVYFRLCILFLFIFFIFYFLFF